MSLCGSKCIFSLVIPFFRRARVSSLIEMEIISIVNAKRRHFIRAVPRLDDITGGIVSKVFAECVRRHVRIVRARNIARSKSDRRIKRREMETD